MSVRESTRARRYLGNAKLNVGSQIEQSHIGKQIVPSAVKAHQVIAKAAPKAAVLVTPFTNHVLAPAAEGLTWDQASRNSY